MFVSVFQEKILWNIEIALSISQKIDNMKRDTDERFMESERKNNKRIRAELKDKISHFCYINR